MVDLKPWINHVYWILIPYTHLRIMKKLSYSAYKEHTYSFESEGVVYYTTKVSYIEGDSHRSRLVYTLKLFTISS